MVIRALYGLKSLGTIFRAFLADHLHDIGYRPSTADPNVWMCPALKSDGFKYYEYILCYVDNILYISYDPAKSMKLIQNKFKFKNNKMETSTTYLGTSITQMYNVHRDLY